MAISHSDIKYIRSLHLKKFRHEHALFIVEGLKMVNELIDSPVEIRHIYCTEMFEALKSVPSDLVTMITEKELQRISVQKSPNKVLAVASIPTSKEITGEESFVLVLDGIRDPGNLGTIIRTAKWFGVSTIVCSEDCTEAFNPKVVQSTMGALFHVDMHQMELQPYLDDARSAGYRIVAAAMNGVLLDGLKPDSKTILVIGSESHGIRPEILDKCTIQATIPNREMDRKVESLNASVAAALMLSTLSNIREQ